MTNYHAQTRQTPAMRQLLHDSFRYKYTRYLTLKGGYSYIYIYIYNIYGCVFQCPVEFTT